VVKIKLNKKKKELNTIYSHVKQFLRRKRKLKYFPRHFDYAQKKKIASALQLLLKSRAIKISKLAVQFDAIQFS